MPSLLLNLILLGIKVLVIMVLSEVKITLYLEDRCQLQGAMHQIMLQEAIP